MGPLEQLAALRELAGAVGVEVRAAPAGAPDGRGGGAMVLLKGRRVVFLEEQSPPQEQAAVLARALAGEPSLEQRYIPPELRELIERAGQEGTG